MNKFKVSIYENNEDYQHGHAITTDEAVGLFQAKAIASNIGLQGNQVCSITFKENDEFEGYIGDYVFNKDVTPFTIDDFWLCPDPNYRGDKDNSFYGSIADYKQRISEQQSDVELD